jgi:N-acetyl-anhydromuramyl-L-alanine amidase AmpD
MSVPPILFYPGGRARILPPLTPPNIRFIGSPNFLPGRPNGPPIAIVIHTMDGFLAGTDSHFQTSSVSAHYGISLAGRIHQYVDLNDRALANGRLEDGNRWFGPAGVNPNWVTVSIETEDGAGANRPVLPVSPELFDSTLALCAEICRTLPSIRFLTSHHMISPETREDCCGDRWTATGKLAQIAERLGLELRI